MHLQKAAHHTGDCHTIILSLMLASHQTVRFRVDGVNQDHSRQGKITAATVNKTSMKRWSP